MKRKIELEGALEERCVAKVEKAGGLALKLVPAGVRGFPDRTILLPGRRVFFIEFKREHIGVIAKQQHRWFVLLYALGHMTYVVDSDERFDEILKKELAG